MRRSLLLGALLFCACEGKSNGPPGLAPVESTTKPSTSTVATAASSAASSASAPPSAAGACAKLAAEKADRCTKLSNGDPTILTGCREAIDTMVKAADDAKCLKAMTPQTEAPSSDPDD
jgi:hypothetical protein